MNVLVVSPHYDDAPLSLGQSMRNGWLERHRVTVGVVFGLSNWTVWFHPTRRRIPLATAIRLVEETHAAVRFGYRVRLAAHREAVVRLDSSKVDALLNAGYDASADPELEAVTATLRRWSTHYDAMLVPAGLGHHVDHTLCAVAGRRLEADGLPVGVYEDRPYACSMSDEDISSHMASLAPELLARDVSGPVGREKHRRLFYPSQFDEYFHDAIAADERGRRRERVWTGPDANWLDPKEIP